MNETQLREGLADAYGDVRLMDPVDDIIRRGKAIRRTRRAPVLALVIAFSAGALAVASPLGDPPSAFATWSESPTPISSSDAATVASRCAKTVPDMPPLTLVDARGDVAFSLFVGNDQVGTCTVIKHDGSWAQGTVGSGVDPVNGRQKVLKGALALQLVASSDLSNAQDHAQAASAWGWVSPAVASVVVRADGHTVQATVRDGAFAAWWPHGPGASRGGALTAFDSAGRQLAQVTIAGGDG